MMRKIGITGGIGCGKSVVSSILRALDYPVYDTDAEAKRLLAENEALKAAMAATFGAETYLPNGEVNRKFLAAVIFSNADKLAEANHLIHPAVIADFLLWAKSHNHKGIAFAESAILFESGMNKIMDKVVIVRAPAETRLRRVATRDGISTDAVRNRMRNQMDDTQRMSQGCDFVIDNGDDDRLLPQILHLLTSLREDDKDAE